MPRHPDVTPRTPGWPGSRYRVRALPLSPARRSRVLPGPTCPGCDIDPAPNNPQALTLGAWCAEVRDVNCRAVHGHPGGTVTGPARHRWSSGPDGALIRGEGPL